MNSLYFTLTAVAVVLNCKQGQATHLLSNGGQIKVILVAGSEGYDNYRHQADLCHAYQILHNNGIPDENIIVMMVDDIANSTDNPDPGVIINRPGGPNVYKGVPKDYVGQEVNKKNLFNILRGDRAAMKGIGTSRVLESGPQDHVFLNFVDHGGPGVLLMPEEEITAQELLNVLKDMHDNSRFAKMFLYIEACESGSVFDNLLPDNMNIFVMTAADPHESSYACFYDDKLQTYLGDVFSVKWMHNAETVDLKQETVNHQFQVVRTETNTSHVEEYGDLDIGVTKMNEVIGSKSTPSVYYELNIKDAVPSHHVPVAILGQRLKSAKTPEERESLRKRLHNMLQGRKQIEHVFLKLLSYVIPSSNMNDSLEEFYTKRPSLTKMNVDCFGAAIKQLTKDCFSISQNPFAASHLHKIINLCNAVPESILREKISTICHNQPQLRGIV